MIDFSENTADLFKAMAEFQKEVKQPKKDKENPFFKSSYVPLENVVDAIHQVGGKHGLSEITYPVQEDNQVGVGVIITHSSGQYVKLPPVLLKPDKNTAQGIGAAITYARRYALSSAFGIASETDDDGNSVNNKNHSKEEEKKPKEQAATDKQIKEIKSLLKQYAEVTGNDDAAGIGKLEAWALGQLKVDNFSEIPEKAVKPFMKKVQANIDKMKPKKEETKEQESLFEGSTTKPKA